MRNADSVLDEKILTPARPAAVADVTAGRERRPRGGGAQPERSALLRTRTFYFVLTSVKSWKVGWRLRPLRMCHVTVMDFAAAR